MLTRENGVSKIQTQKDSEIVQQVTGSGHELESHKDDEDCLIEVGCGPSNSQAAEMLEKCLTWYEKQPEVSSTSLLHLRRIRDLVSTKRFAMVGILTSINFNDFKRLDFDKNI